jgi:lysozyme
MSNLQQLFHDLIRDEGLRLRPYRCTAGKLTIGVGRNLDDVGISQKEAMEMLKNDIEKISNDGRIRNIIEGHNSVRQNVMLNMAFNLGIEGLLKFKNMLSAFAKRDYRETAKEMQNSVWFEQVGVRAVRLQNQMLKGE